MTATVTTNKYGQLVVKDGNVEIHVNTRTCNPSITVHAPVVVATVTVQPQSPALVDAFAV